MTKSSNVPAFNAPLPVDRVGCVVWWSANQIQVDPTVLKAAMIESGCEQHTDLVRRPAEVVHAMRRAMRRRQGAAMAEGWRWEEVPTPASANGDLLIALAQSHRDSAALQPFSATTRLTVTVAKGTGVLQLSRANLNAEETSAFDALRDRYQIERGFLTAEDVRALLVKVLLDRSKGTRAKAGGAVYFVPAPSDEVIDTLAPAVASAGIRLVRFPVDTSGAAQLREGASEGIHEEVEALKKGVADRLAAVVDGADVRFETLAKRLEEAETLRSKARLYEHLLGCELAAAHEALAESDQLVRETMKRVAERAAAKA